MNRLVAGWALAVVLPSLATVAGVSFASLFRLSTDVVLFFLATVLVALGRGAGAGAAGRALSGLLLNYFLTPPLYTFTIAERENVIAAGGDGGGRRSRWRCVVDRAARRAEQAAQARTEAALLASFARTVLTRWTRCPGCWRRSARRSGCARSPCWSGPRRSRAAGATWPAWARRTCLRPEDAEVDVEVDPDIHLIGQGRPLAAGDRRVLETVGGQALLALRGQRMAAEAAEAHRQVEGSQLRSALLSAVGHDLRTPLTSIKAAAGSLRDTELALSDGDRAELLATVEESADRLTALVEQPARLVPIGRRRVVPGLEPVATTRSSKADVGQHRRERLVDLHTTRRTPSTPASASATTRR